MKPDTGRRKDHYVRRTISKQMTAIDVVGFVPLMRFL